MTDFILVPSFRTIWHRLSTRFLLVIDEGNEFSIATEKLKKDIFIDNFLKAQYFVIYRLAVITARQRWTMVSTIQTQTRKTRPGSASMFNCRHLVFKDIMFSKR